MGDEASLGMKWEKGDFLVTGIGEVSIKTVLWDFNFIVCAPGVLGDDCDDLKKYSRGRCCQWTYPCPSVNTEVCIKSH